MKKLFILLLTTSILLAYDPKLREEFLDNFSKLQKAIQEKQNDQEKKKQEEVLRAKESEEERRKKLETFQFEQNYMQNELDFLRLKEQYEREIEANNIRNMQKEFYNKLSSQDGMLLKVNISSISGKIDIGGKKRIVLRGQDIDRLTESFINYLKNKDNYQSTLFGVQNIYKELEFKFGQESGYFVFEEGQELTHNIKLIEIKDNIATFLVKL